MKTIDAIYKRRAVRSYTSREVNRETLESLMKAATQAPSAMNSQPWAFVIIQDENLLKHYSDEAKKTILKEQNENSPFNPYIELMKDPSYNIFYDAKTLVLFCAKPDGHDPSGDCHLAAQNFMLAACDLGLATCPIGFAREVLNRSEIKRELRIPPQYSVVLPIIVGYPRGETAPVERKSPEVLKWIKAP